MGMKEPKHGRDPADPGNLAARGRPKGSESAERTIPDALLAAANRFMAEEKSSNVPVRKIASMAGVNQAMINYYFNNKDGLYLAIFENNFFPLIKKLEKFELDCKSENSVDISISRLLLLIDDHFKKSPSLFVLHKDMLGKDSELNRSYSEKIGSRGYNAIVRIMRLLIEKGICRSDISAEHAAYLICVLGAVHYIMTPMAETAFHGLMDGDGPSQLGALATLLLSPPAAAPEASV